MDAITERDFLLSQKTYLDILLSGKIPKIAKGNDAGKSAVGEPAPRDAAEQNSATWDPTKQGPMTRNAIEQSSATWDPTKQGPMLDIPCGLIEEQSQKLETLIGQLAEMKDFVQALSQGDLDATVPGRRNYISAPLKELHTQLLSLTWSMEQLAKGHVVGHLYYKGVLFEAFNSLIEKVASVSNRLETAKTKNEPTWDWSVNSWKYHQILSALNNLRIMVLEVGLDGKIIYANRPAKEYFGEIESLSRTPKDTVSFANVLEDYLTQIGGQNDAVEFPLFKEIYDESKNCWYKITSDRLHFSDTRTGYLHMIDNISEWKNNENNLLQTATTDPLTGIYNRRYGLQALEDALYSAKSGIASCAAFIDLDGLKVINDLYGHNSGDEAIKTLAQVLSSSVRDNKDIVCRFGGDEFVIIFKNCKEPSAKLAVERMQKKLDEVNAGYANGYALDFSHGIVEIDGARDKSLLEVIEHMDQLMYKNKAAKKMAANHSAGDFIINARASVNA